MDLEELIENWRGRASGQALLRLETPIVLKGRRVQPQFGKNRRLTGVQLIGTITSVRTGVSGVEKTP